MASAAHAQYKAELAELRARHLPNITALLRGPLLAAPSGQGSEQDPLARLRQRLKQAVEVLSQAEDAPPMLDMTQLRSLSKDLAANPLLKIGQAPPQPLPPPPQPPPPPPPAIVSTQETAAASGPRADPRHLQLAAALLARKQPAPQQRSTPAPAAPDDDPDTAAVLQRLQRLMYSAGDASTPRLECARLVLKAILDWQQAMVANAIGITGGSGSSSGGASSSSGGASSSGGGASSSGGGGSSGGGPVAPAYSENMHLRMLKATYPDEWERYTWAEGIQKKVKKAMDDDGAPTELLEDDNGGSDDDDDDEVDGEIDAARPLKPLDGAAGGGAGASGGLSSAESRMKMLDERTRAMSDEEYESFAQVRALSSLCIVAFSRLSSANLAAVLRPPLKAPATGASRPESNRRSHTSTVGRFIAKLCADRVAEVVELANRAEHSGELRLLCSDAPLALSSYQGACERFRATAVRALGQQAQPHGQHGAQKRPREAAAASDANGSAIDEVAVAGSTVVVTVPEGVGPGDMFALPRLKAANGAAVRVKVPPGIAPGQRLGVKIPG